MMRDLDDSNEHEVWNDADSYRVVLFVDFVHPTVFPLSMVNRAIIWGRGRYPLERNVFLLAILADALWFVSNSAKILCAGCPSSE
jgi:hypothetical protein